MIIDLVGLCFTVWVLRRMLGKVSDEQKMIARLDFNQAATKALADGATPEEMDYACERFEILERMGLVDITVHDEDRVVV